MLLATNTAYLVFLSSKRKHLQDQKMEPKCGTWRTQKCAKHDEKSSLNLMVMTGKDVEIRDRKKDLNIPDRQMAKKGFLFHSMEWIVINELKVLMKDKVMSATGAVRASCSAATTCDPACHSHSIAMTIIIMPTPGGGDKPVLVTNRTPPRCDANNCWEDFTDKHTQTPTRVCAQDGHLKTIMQWWHQWKFWLTKSRASSSVNLRWKLCFLAGCDVMYDCQHF